MSDQRGILLHYDVKIPEMSSDMAEKKVAWCSLQASRYSSDILLHKCLPCFQVKTVFPKTLSLFPRFKMSAPYLHSDIVLQSLLPSDNCFSQLGCTACGLFFLIGPSLIKECSQRSSCSEKKVCLSSQAGCSVSCILTDVCPIAPV